MKKFIIGLIFGFTATYAQAQHGHYNRPYFNQYQHHHHRSSGWNWVAPAIVGGVIVYGLTRPNVVPAQPVYIERMPPVPYNPPYGYHWEQVLDANCNCYRMVLLPN